MFSSAVLMALISETGGRYRPAPNSSGRLQGDRDCWQCRKCFARFELKADSRPESTHATTRGTARPRLVDQTRDDRLAAKHERQALPILELRHATFRGALLAVG